MERPYKFNTTKIMLKQIGGTEENPKYSKKSVNTKFVCDLDDIKFVDYAIKDSGEIYKTKCVITHYTKGEILVNHKFDDLKDIIKNKFKSSYVRIKGFRK